MEDCLSGHEYAQGGMEDQMRFFILLFVLFLFVPATAQGVDCWYRGMGEACSRSRNVGSIENSFVKKPSPAEIQAWMKAPCGSPALEAFMESSGYPRRKCKPSPPLPSIGCIDTGNSCGSRIATSHTDIRDWKMPIEKVRAVPKPEPSLAKNGCEYRGQHSQNGKLFSRYAMRAVEELELDRCTAERRSEHTRKLAEYNARMAVWSPCATDAHKIARANFETDEQWRWRVVEKCGAQPVRPAEPEPCTNFWSGFETASQYDPRWIYLRHLEIWEVCLHKQVSRAKSGCEQGDAEALERADEEIERQCGPQPSRPVIDGLQAP